MATTDLARDISRKELLLLLLYAPVEGHFNYPIEGRTRLAKMVFLFRKELWKDFRFDQLIPEDFLYKFRAWKFGPYSKEVFSDIDFFRSVGFLKSESTGPASREEALELSHWSGTQTVDYGSAGDESVDEYAEEEFRLSDDGVRYVEEKGLWNLLSEGQAESLSTFKERMTSAPLYAILSYVYDKYPDMAEESEIREQFAH